MFSPSSSNSLYEYQIYNSGGEVAKAEGKADEAAPAPKEIQQEIIASPLIGNIVPLNRIPDQVFALGAMGKGIAIDPTDGVVVAQAKAIVNLVFPTGHAIDLQLKVVQTSHPIVWILFHLLVNVSRPM